VKKAYAVAIQRPSPPLTNLSDEDDRTAELKEKLKELENMRRDLALIRMGLLVKKIGLPVVSTRLILLL